MKIECLEACEGVKMEIFSEGGQDGDLNGEAVFVVASECKVMHYSLLHILVRC